MEHIKARVRQKQEMYDGRSFWNSVLFFVVYSLPTAYTSLYRGLEHLLQIPHFIKNHLNVVGSLIIDTIPEGRSAALPYLFENNITKMNTHLNQTFTDCVFNQYTHFDVMICQMWPQVMEHSLILLRFYRLFIHK